MFEGHVINAEFTRIRECRHPGIHRVNSEIDVVLDVAVHI
jgi:hypothetical protein